MSRVKRGGEVPDDPFAAWEVPRGLLYSDHNVRAYVGAVMEAFNPKWFHRGALRSDPLRQAWNTRVDPYSVITLCRVGRDIWKLKQRQDPDQDAHLAGLVHRAKKADRMTKAMEDYLHELHTAMLFDEASGAVGHLASPTQQGYDVVVRLSRGRTLWVACKLLHTSEDEEHFLRLASTLRQEMGTIAERCGHLAIDGVVFTETPLPDVARSIS